MRLLYLLLALPQLVVGQFNQEFWKPIPVNPSDGPTVFFTIATDDRDDLYLGTSQGIFKSSNNGHSWEHILSGTTPFFNLAVSGELIYGTSMMGEIYVSRDGGSTWSSRQLPLDGHEGITDLLLLDNGDVLVSTGYIVELNEAGYFRGKGIYRSQDKGRTWNRLTLGLDQDHYIAHLAKDSKGRIFASAHEFFYADGCILYSEDGGDSWKTIKNVLFDWGGEDGLETSQIVQVTNLEIDPSDNIRLSMLGASGTVATSVNLFNTFQGIQSGSEWTHMRIVSFGYPWLYLEAHNTYFAKNGDIYAHRPGASFNLSGTFYSKQGAPFEKKHLNPLIVDGYLYFNYAVFAEQSNGRVFAVQQMGSEIYYTGKAISPLATDEENSFRIFPNPAQEYLHIRTKHSNQPVEVKIFTLTGTRVYQMLFEAQSQPDIDIRGIPAGTYLVQLNTGNSSECYKVSIQ